MIHLILSGWEKPLTDALMHVNCINVWYIDTWWKWMGMKPDQQGKCWCMRYHGGRLATELSWWHLGFAGFGWWLLWWAIRTLCWGAILPNLFLVRPHDLVSASLSLIPLANLVVARGGYVWVGDLSGQYPRDCGRLGEIEPWLGVDYDRAVMGRW
jgi:hypothetical protein